MPPFFPRFAAGKCFCFKRIPFQRTPAIHAASGIITGNRRLIILQHLIHRKRSPFPSRGRLLLSPFHASPLFQNNKRNAPLCHPQKGVFLFPPQTRRDCRLSANDIFPYSLSWRGDRKAALWAPKNGLSSLFSIRHGESADSKQTKPFPVQPFLEGGRESRSLGSKERPFFNFPTKHGENADSK